MKLKGAMEWKLTQKKGNKNVKATIPNTDYERSKATGEYRIFKVLGRHDNKR